MGIMKKKHFMNYHHQVNERTGSEKNIYKIKKFIMAIGHVMATIIGGP